MSSLALFLFGSPHIEHNGMKISVDTRKAIALLIYLVITRQRHRRDTLVNLLWPEYDQSHARATLRRTLSTLNKALDGQWLTIERDTIAITASTHIWTDVENFHDRLSACRSHDHRVIAVCPACLPLLEEAATLYQDDFLAGFHLQDSTNFDAWQFFQADSLRHEYAYVLERLVHGYSLRAEFERALSRARQWLELDRLHEPAQQALMQLYAWTGQRAASLQQYEECIHLLKKELGVKPLATTTQIYLTVKANHPLPRPTSAHYLWHPPQHRPYQDEDLSLHGVSMLPVATHIYPLVGRTEERAQLFSAYQQAQAHGHVIVLEGEAGIGKTRLVEELLTHAGHQNAPVIVARCYEGESYLAYSPIAAGIRTTLAQAQHKHKLQHISHHWLREAARLLPELAGPVATTASEQQTGTQQYFFESLRQIVLALCTSEATISPGLLVFEDIHWADVSSIEFITYLTRRIYDVPICLVITGRYPRAKKNQQLFHSLIELQQQGHATLLALTRLSLERVSHLVEESPGLMTITKTVNLSIQLYRETEGLPLFLIEYLTALATGSLHGESHSWPLPPRLRSVLTSRLHAIGESSRQLLGAAAAIGRSFDFDTVRVVNGQSEEETVVALEELINQELIQEVRAGLSTTEALAGSTEQVLLYIFTHEKIRALVYEETSQARRRLLHRRIAAAMIGRVSE